MIRKINFSTKDVRRDDTPNLVLGLAKLERNPEHVRQVQGTFVLTFPEFEDAEVVYLVPEVKIFLRKLHQQVPHLLYYLAPEPEFGGLLAFMAVHAPAEEVSISNGEVIVRLDTSLKSMLIDRLTATAKFARRMADDPVPIVSRWLESFDLDFRQQVLDTVMAALDYT